MNIKMYFEVIKYKYIDRIHVANWNLWYRRRFFQHDNEAYFSHNTEPEWACERMSMLQEDPTPWRHIKIWEKY